MKPTIILMLSCLVVLMTLTQFCYSDDPEEDKDDDKSLDDVIEDSAKGFGNWFKGASDNVKEKSETGFGALKDWAGGLSDRFGKTKEKVEEAGEKVKKAVEDTASSVKEEVETGASKVSEHAKEAMDKMKELKPPGF